jgi:SpoIID/LytB domain protein
VLYYNDKLAKCYYCASNGGQTTSSKERWSGDYPYLISQPDEFDKGPKNGHGVGLSQ